MYCGNVYARFYAYIVYDKDGVKVVTHLLRSILFFFFFLLPRSVFLFAVAVAVNAVLCISNRFADIQTDSTYTHETRNESSNNSNGWEWRKVFESKSSVELVCFMGFQCVQYLHLKGIISSFSKFILDASL